MIQRPDNLTDLVFAEIRDRIVNASLPPGSPVSEATLARELMVSKTPVREALLRMRRIGLVEPTPRGLRVTLASARSVREAFEYRAVLESDAATYASRHATGEQLEVIARWAAESLDCARGGDPSGFRRADQEFHVAVANASGNGCMRSAVEDAFVLTVALRRRDVGLVRDLVPDALEHLEIADALCERNSTAASTLLSGHALRIMDQLLDAMAQSAAVVAR
ncbi:GntR family transcriptional regulator [Streptomyces dioscori]|uniref:GntR family transcriptional regulator n=1 Tax=Streptomyces dioscori TaxID=2109333 RepID=A0A2P8PYG0_9ACTN|nr:GntR family transcriptional regulator [Streptomyces dioscori]PSM39021.1 GntR family transcriptional regulator [Streptomyces dioscori]